MADEKDRGIGSEIRRTVGREAEELGLDRTNFVKEALRWQYNWIGLAGAAAFALISGTGLPLLMAAGLELIYLSVVPQSSRFRRLVRSWKYAEEKRRHDARLAAFYHELPPEMRTRYADVDKMCRAIRANYQRLSSTSQIFVGQMEDKLQGLTQAYIRLLHGANQHREYLRQTDPEAIKREVAALQRALGADSPKVQEINRKRIDILSRRLAKFDKIRENRQVIDAQCSAIEDVLELIRDQSVTMRDPQELTDQLATLMSDVEQTEETIREVEAIFDMAVPDMSEMPSLLGDSRSDSVSSSRTRGRTRN